MPSGKPKGSFKRRKLEFVAFQQIRGGYAQEVPLRGCVGVGVRLDGKLLTLDESENGVGLSSEGGKLVLKLRDSAKRVVVEVE